MIKLIASVVCLYPFDIIATHTHKHIDILNAYKDNKICSLIGVEGGHSISGSLAVLRMFYMLGVRYMTLTSTCHTPWADSSFADAPKFDAKHNGLTDFGKVSKPNLDLWILLWLLMNSKCYVKLLIGEQTRSVQWHGRIHAQFSKLFISLSLFALRFFFLFF